MKYIPRLIEAELKKASKSFSAVILTSPLERLAGTRSRYTIDKYLVHRESKDNFPTTALRSGVKALPVSQLGSILSGC